MELKPNSKKRRLLVFAGCLIPLAFLVIGFLGVMDAVSRTPPDWKMAAEIATGGIPAIILIGIIFRRNSDAFGRLVSEKGGRRIYSFLLILYVILQLFFWLMSRAL